MHNLLTTQIAVLTDSARTEASMRGVMDRELKIMMCVFRKFRSRLTERIMKRVRHISLMLPVRLLRLISSTGRRKC